MSVLKRNRHDSNCKFLTQAVKVAKFVNIIALKDFGYRKYLKDIHFLKKSLTPEETEQLEAIEKRLGAENRKLKVTFVYPEYFMNIYRDLLIKTSLKLEHDARAAYSFYPATQVEYDMKIKAINDAILDCYELHHGFCLAIDLLNLNPNKWTALYDQVDEEIRLLKGLLSSTRRKAKEAFKDNDAKS